MKLFIRIKHWQLFLLMFVPYLIGQILFIFEAWDYIAIPLFWFWTIVQALWKYFVGLGAIKITRQELKNKTKLFKMAIILFKTAIIVELCGFILVPMRSLWDKISYFETNNIILEQSFMVLFFSSFIYSTFYVSNRIISLESNSIASINEKDIFFSFLISPFGVWFLQPKINTLINEKLEAGQAFSEDT